MANELKIELQPDLDETEPKEDVKSKNNKKNGKNKKGEVDESKLTEKQKNKLLLKQNISFDKFPFLKNIKPREKYVFHSDYFQIDNYYACIVSFFHNQASNDNFGAFWGINRIPSGLDKKVTTINFEQVSRMSESWIASHQKNAENVATMNENTQYSEGTMTSKMKASKAQEDLNIIARELNDGASYLFVQNRMMVKAPTLEMLDNTIDKIERLFMDRFGTLRCAPFQGQQRIELNRLFNKNSLKAGRGFYFTSTEFAGSYSLVTHGLEDIGGEYVGYMVGDVNNSAVLFDVDRYRHHCVVASEQLNLKRNRAHVADMWGSKISQAALLNNHKVVHLILDDAKLDRLGPKFEDITYKIDMSHGDVNMFEMFGETKDELSIFPTQIEKLKLMAEQAYETTDSDRSVIRGSLEDVATKFYVDNRMWFENAVAHRDRLRIVGIPHEEVPKLDMFVSYLDTEYKAMVMAEAKDPEKLHAMSILSTTFRNLLSSNGDLFNTITNDIIDGAKSGLRTVYDFSGLMYRGRGVAMAQLVNVIGFAVGNLGLGDVVIIHGAENIDSTVHKYIEMQLAKLFDMGGRVVYLYNHIDKMLEDKEFNEFDKCDYTIFGNMTDTVIEKYQKLLGQDIPRDLVKLITDKSSALSYVHRGFDNVVFYQDLLLDNDEQRMSGWQRQMQQ